MRARTSRLAAVVVVVLVAGALAACGDDRGAAPVTLPSTAAGGVAIGDLAGVVDENDASVRNPYRNDPVALRQGEQLFNQMNCVDCHGYDGQGGMGPSLIDGEWLFGDTPADKFVSIHRGRSRGMPAYGRMLPDESIWQVVAYLDELHANGGRTGSAPRRSGGEAASATRQQTQGGRH